MIPTIKQESKVFHPLAKFVTVEAIAQLLNLHPEQIYDIRCWPTVILVIGKGISTFISYADLPPIVEAQPPSDQDILCWRKRWKKKSVCFCRY